MRLRRRSQDFGRTKTFGRTSWALMVVLAVVLMAALATTAAATPSPPGFDIQRVTDNTVAEDSVRVSGDRLVWSASVGGDWEIFTWKVGDTEPPYQVTTNDDIQDGFPDVSGDRIVWQDSDRVVWTWKVGDAANTPLMNAGALGVNPQVSGDRVVWYFDDGNDNEIATWKDGVTTQITDNLVDDQNPQVEGDRVVWQGEDGGDCDIFTWTPDDGSEQISTSTAHDYMPMISGDRVAWYGTDGEIYLWQVGDTSPTNVTNSARNDYGVEISGDRLAWHSTDADYNHVLYTWKVGDTELTQLPGGGTAQNNVRVSGDWLIWFGGVEADDEVFAWHVGDTSPTQVTSNTYHDRMSEIDGVRVVWYGNAETTYGTPEVFTTLLAPQPVVSGISPSSGPDSGGQSVTISGTGLNHASEVKIGKTPATSFTVVSDTEITAVTPAHDAGLVTVRVTTAGGASAETNNYTYVDLPNVTSVDPAMGPMDGDQEVLITGEKLSDVTQVTFGGIECTDFWVESDTAISAVTPAHDAGLVSVVVTDSDGSSVETDNYTYTDLPVVEWLDPSVGPQGGGTTVSIYGYNFTAATAVTFGGEAASFEIIDSEEIEVTTPAMAQTGTVDVQVTTDFGVSDTSGTTDDYTYVAQPVVDEISPDWGSSDGGDDIVITGSHFTDNMQVYFGGAPVAAADFEFVDETEIHVVSPSWFWGGEVMVRLVNDGGTAGDRFIYDPVIDGGNWVVTALRTEGFNYGVQVDGGRVVWVGTGGTGDYGDDTEVFTWTIATGVVQLTDDAVDQYGVYVSGNRLIWLTDNADDNGYALFTYKIGDEKEVKLSEDLEEYWAAVSGDRVVWAAPGGYGDVTSDCEIFLWMPGAAAAQLTDNADDDVTPQISGERVAWNRYFDSDDDDSWDGADIYTRTLSGDEVQVTSAEGTEDDVVLSGDRVGYSASSPWPQILHTKLVDGADEALTDGSAWDGSMTIDGDRIAWSSYDWETQAESITSWTPSGGVEVVAGLNIYGQMDPRVSGDRLVWLSRETGESGLDVVTWAPGEGYDRLTNESYDHFEPAISGDRIAWDTYVDGEMHIYMATPPAPTVDLLSVNSGPDTGGTSVVITGTGFAEVSSVTFGGTEAAEFTVDSDTQITAKAPAHAFGTVAVQVTAVGGLSDDTSADDFTYLETKATRFQETDGRMVYSPAWGTSSYWRYSGLRQKYSFSRGASVTIPFRGTRLDYITKTAGNLGIASVSVDGGAPTSVDLYTASTVYRQKVWSTGTLTNGLHVVKIVLSGTKNPRSSGTAVNIDAVDVVGTLVGATRYQETESSLIYTAGWSTTWSWRFSAGKMKICVSPPPAAPVPSSVDLATAGDVEVAVTPIGPGLPGTPLPTGAVVVRFDGVKLNLVATKARTYGKAWVSVDGGPRVLVDLYRYYTKYKQTVYSTGWLAPGPHTVTISWSGYKNYYSKGKSINVDAFDIVGTIGLDL